MKYLINTNYYPKKKFEFFNDYHFEIVINPYSKNIQRNNLHHINGQFWKYSLVISDNFSLSNELIQFHSFFTNNFNTYNYAENCSTLFFDDNDLEFIHNSDQVQTHESVSIVDFNEFPVLIGCNYAENSNKEFNYINYRKAFEVFLLLKDKIVNIFNVKINLFELICLYNYARNFDYVQRLYRNSNIPLSFFITIVESIIGKPEKCSSILCEKCNNDIPHSKISLEKHFKNYVEKFSDIRTIRHKTFHSGKLFDFENYLINLINNK
ncbi:MAG: hypothetical protein PF486_11185, partial [Prolixibacteraceae bacterium]|nr:hypothetical protein [Prolixibacteraceae bacterium]